MTLSPQDMKDFLHRGFTRRNFGRIATMVAGASTLPFYNEPALAQLSRVRDIPPDAVLINANENPLGPCAEARDAIHNIVSKGGRYHYEETDKVAKILQLAGFVHLTRPVLEVKGLERLCPEPPADERAGN